MAHGKWVPGMHRAVAKKFKVTESCAARWAMDASIQTRAVIDKHWITALFASAMAELHATVQECNEKGLVREKIIALHEILTFATKVSGDEPMDRRKPNEVALQLIADGWTPPPLRGLPAPDTNEPDLAVGDSK